MKKLEATITVDNLVSTMKTSMPSEKILRERMKYFVLQDFLGILYTTGRLVPGKQLVFKISLMWRLDG
jgi:hypothetical protein